MKLKEFLLKIKEELDCDITKQRRRYLESYYDELMRYIDMYPNNLDVPTFLDLHCCLHPESPECLEYDI